MSVSEWTVGLDPGELLRLRQRATVIVTAPAVFRIEGPGVVECLQGLLTNDVVGPGPNSLVYGALLTPKGMIVVDYWVWRDEAGFTLVAPRVGRESSRDLFRRQLPPRLARVSERTDQWLACWFLGTGVEAAARTAALSWPATPGRITDVETTSGSATIGLPEQAAPWQAIAVGPAEAIREMAARVVAAGAFEGGPAELESARIVAGWPGLGAEIEEKTLPQEVRYDELGGVSYTKGCYVGQETVARVHFRGHPNRLLRGLAWDGGAHLGDATVTFREREVGRVRSVLETGPLSLGLVVLRREVEPGSTVTIGQSAAARVFALPFPDELLPH